MRYVSLCLLATVLTVSHCDKLPKCDSDAGLSLKERLACFFHRPIPPSQTDAGAPATPTDGGAPDGGETPASSSEGAATPANVTAVVASDSCNDCDYWQRLYTPGEEYGIVSPINSSDLVAMSRVMVVGSEIPPDLSSYSLLIYKGDSRYGMYFDENEIDAKGGKLYLQNNSKKGVIIKGPDNNWGGSSPTAALEIRTSTNNQKMWLDGNEIDSNSTFYLNYNSSTNVTIAHGGGNVYLATGGGNVGIGTSSPNNKLDVAGTIRAYEIVVETGWSDFVFAKNYPLKSLSEVDSYIIKNGHLPDVPSAKDVKKQGVPLGQSQAKLLQKIEELTLYLIEQNKKISAMQSEIDSLRALSASRKKSLSR